jgi:hypothetical protein
MKPNVLVQKIQMCNYSSMKKQKSIRIYIYIYNKDVNMHVFNQK